MAGPKNGPQSVRLRLFRPAGLAASPVLLICPGGAYHHRSDNEGSAYAEFFSDFGIAGAVLDYRLGSQGFPYPAPLEDGRAAMRWLRQEGANHGLDPRRVGVIGSSAGGHLAALLLTESDPTVRPDLGLLCYPVISLRQFPHPDTRANFLGPQTDPDTEWQLSAENRVHAQTPACFVWASAEDRTVACEHSLLFVQALRQQGIGCEFHLYETGKHGMGLGDSPAHPWTKAAVRWLAQKRFIP